MEAMEVFSLEELAARAAAGEPYGEFLRVPDLSLGLYVLGRGAVDRQQPHTEDEAYVVLAGRSRFTAGSRTRDVRAGDTIFVPAGVPHRFHDITEQLRLIVVFGPAEGTRAATAAADRGAATAAGDRGAATGTSSEATADARATGA